MKSKAILLVVFIFLLGCKKDETIVTDISVVAKAEKLIYTDQNDLLAKLNLAFDYNYGEANLNEVVVNREYNRDTTRVVETIEFKTEFLSKYEDQNISNNTAIIDLEKSQVYYFEGSGSGSIGDYNIASSPWPTCDITFSFFNYTSDLAVKEQEDAFLEAGLEWTNSIAGMNFINVGANNNTALIKVYFANSISHPPCQVPFESNGTIAHAFFPFIRSNIPAHFAGDVHFRDDEFNFTNTTGFSAAYDFISIATHEIGHSLGIDHENSKPNAIMYYQYSSGTIKRNLIQDDINAIESLYTNNCLNNASSTISVIGDLNFGLVNIGSISPQKSFIVRNTGNASFSITNISMPNGFVLVNGSNTTILPNAEKTFYVTFNPTQAQNYSGNVVVISNASNNSNNNISASGIGASSGSSTISLTGNLNFGNVAIGQSSTLDFTIQNTGNQSLNVSNINLPYNVYSANWSSGTISAGASQKVSITFQPMSQQSYNGSITVNSDATNGSNIVSINGSGSQNSQNVTLSYSNNLIKDGTGGGVGNSNGIIESGEEIDLEVELINTGTTTATNISAVLSTSDPDITVTASTLSWNDIQGGSSRWKSDFDFDVSPNCPTKSVTFTLQIMCAQGNWTQNFTVNVQNTSGGGGGSPVSITPSNSCSSAPLMQVNTEYTININTSNYSLGLPIANESAGGNNVRGFWLAVQLPSNGYWDFKLYNASSNFNAVLGEKFSCGGSFLQQYISNDPFTYINSTGSGGNESFEAWRSANHIMYIRIYHYDGSQTPNISFKAKVEL